MQNAIQVLSGVCFFLAIGIQVAFCVRMMRGNLVLGLVSLCVPIIALIVAVMNWDDTKWYLIGYAAGIFLELVLGCFSS